MLFSPAAFQFVLSQQGRAQLVYQDFIYNFHEGFPSGREYWLCRDYRKFKCRSSLVKDGLKLENRGQSHNHGPHTHILRHKQLLFASPC
ncbi:hypothetical protein PR048_032478 [Dryococelus australis]|uniref:FLYWCH-type domain-containing protein n=1 Tax=Dryococelus australis TaxID=614101 RepID=A0ABQ9G2A6_9NEOP|nr:hypothetical protein PR048_032478 [Dryococelus australis]